MGRVTGRTVEVGGGVRAFVPAPLPPAEPAIKETDERLVRALNEAEAQLGVLALAVEALGEQGWLSYACLRQEALLSCQIEGALVSFSALLKSEAHGEELSPGVIAVGRYLASLEHGRKELKRKGGQAISLRLLRQIHGRLLDGGEFRLAQNWIGGSGPESAEFVPPPPPEMMLCLNELERYMQQSDAGDELSALVRIGLIHGQFETIHPFADGNGRMGRILIPLLLESWGLSKSAVPVSSAFFKQHQPEYYARLNAIRHEGDWEGWLRFFCEAVSAGVSETLRTAARLQLVWQKDQRRLLERRGSTVPALRLFSALRQMPVVSSSRVARALELSAKGASQAIQVLCDAGVLRANKARSQEPLFEYKAYVRALGD